MRHFCVGHEMSPQNARNGISEYCFSVEYPRPIYNCDHVYTAISIKVVPEQSGKIEYEREMLAENR